MTTVLLTGFEPFAGAERNASWDAVRLLSETWPGPETLVVAELPVEFSAGPRMLSALVAEHSPDLVIATGLAENRRAITPELLAKNVDDARIPDNAGDQPRDRRIDEQGAVTLPTQLPVHDIVAALAAAGIPAQSSSDAGEFVCNHVMYRMLAERMPGGFVHVPQAPSTLTIEEIARGLGITVRTALDARASAQATNHGG